MKFRVKTCDLGCIQYFSKIVTMMSHLSKNCIMRFTQDHIYFVVDERSSSGHVVIWCEIKKNAMFSECAMEGLDDENNEILCEVILDQMMKCLRMTTNSRSLKIKLVKRNTPCLSLEIEQPTVTNQCRLVVHDIPVRLVPLRNWDEFRKQPDPDFDVSIYFPPLRIVRSVIDKMKNLSNLITLSGNNSGDLHLKVKTDLVSVCSYFSDLGRPQWRHDAPTQMTDDSAAALVGEVVEPKRDKKEFVGATIDIRRLNQLLSSQKCTPNKIICNIVKNKMVQMFILYEDVQLRYFIPVVHT